ncbi:unnamed protein product [Oikopleura dioica]|uniref:Uncharacterized protein n=1 Tax=Oikopleura dioica TaxID=34765 RepID=E4WW21_OIKDI|nr:unnamed protein product [Oikopleura dioica]
MQAWRASVDEQRNPVFVMDKSGVVTVAAEIDLEDPEGKTKTQYKFKVTASNTKTSEASFCWLLIHVNDVNDNEPVFGQTEYKFEVHESTPVRTIVGSVDVTDKDLMDQANLRLSLIEQGTKSPKSPDDFTIDKNGRIMTHRELDREQIASYKFYVIAKDSQSPIHQSQAKVEVSILDDNDSPPVFAKDELEVHLSEGTKIGTKVISVKATDADEGENGKVTYALMNDKDTFAVDATSGNISLIRDLDFEVNRKFELRVRAQDHGRRRQESIVTVTVVIVDLNDNAPHFNINPLVARVKEDAKIGHTVTFAIASDKDDPNSPNGRLSYTLISPNLLPFAIDKNTGRITLVKILDRELIDHYKFQVKATDGGGLSDIVDIVVNLIDVNDSPPKFSQSSYSVKVAEDSRPGQIIGKIAATDSDSGDNARVSYTIGEGTIAPEEVNKLFKLNEETGVISLAENLDNEQKKYYSFEIIAKDHGIPQKSDRAKVEINVMDVNDNPPVFEKREIKVTIAEDSAVNSIITTVIAQDADEGPNGAISYQLSRVDPNEAGYFLIDTYDGTIRLGKPLDRETTPCYELEIEARDHGTPSLYAKATVMITVLDVNDNAPHFESSKKRYYVREDKDPGTIIAKIEADDRDIGDNANLEYFLLPNRETNNMFYLDSATGELELRQALDFEKKRNYTITVQVFSDSLQTTEDLIIEVMDINDNTPTLKDMYITFNNFVQKSTSSRPALMEDVAGDETEFPINQVIGKLNFYDPDVMDIFEFGQEGQEELVKVNKTSGELAVGPNLAAIREFTAPIRVWIKDGLNKAEATLTIEVKMVTDEALENAIVLTVVRQNLEQFLQVDFQNFRSSVSRAVGVAKADHVIIFDAQQSADNIEIILAMRKNDADYFSTSELSALVYLNQRSISPRIAELSDSETCSREPCQAFNICVPGVAFAKKAEFVKSRDVIFRRLVMQKRTRCVCPSGYGAGQLCQSPVNSCWSSPCQNGGTCTPMETGYVCQCPADTRGKHCELVEGKGRCDDGPLTCGGGAKSCQNLLKGGYECKCHPGVENKFCDADTRSFNGKNSFIMLPGMASRWELTVEFELRTVVKNAIVLHNGRLSPDGDHFSVLLRNGKLYVEVSTGGKTHALHINRNIASGEFEKVRVQYRHEARQLKESKGEFHLLDGKGKRRVLNIMISDCFRSDGNECAAELAITDQEPATMDLTGPLFVGGVPEFLRDDGFTGCLRNLKINGKFEDLMSPLASSNSQVGCEMSSTSCDDKICNNVGTCTKLGGQIQCSCPDHLTGNRCETNTKNHAKRLVNGYIRVRNLKNLVDRLDFEVYFQIRTESTSTSILTFENDETQLVIVDGYLQLHTKRSRHSCADQCITALISDGEWHQIRVKASTNRTYVFVDDQLIINARSGTATPTSGLIIGDKSKHNLVGCIAGVKVTDVRSGVSESPLMSQVGTILDGCNPQKSCKSTTCSKGAECKETWAGTTCECKDGFFGPNCAGVCSVNPCLNGGVCKPLGKDGFTCSCPTEFSGKFCERQSSCPKSWSGSVPGSCRPCNCTQELGFAESCSEDINDCKCKDNYYRPKDQPWKCVPCNCDRLGAESPTCSDETGACSCRRGVFGRQCDKCSNQFAEVTLKGCEILGSEVCPRNSEANVVWDRVNYGATVTTECPAGSSGLATRDCTRLGWAQPDLDNCQSERFSELARFQRALKSNSRTLSTQKAVNLAEHLFLALEDPDERTLFGQDIQVAFNLLLDNFAYQNTHSGYDLSMTSSTDFSKHLFAASARMIHLSDDEWSTLDPLAAVYILNAVASYAETIAANLPRTFTSKISAKHPLDSGDDLAFLAINGTSNEIIPSADAMIHFDASKLVGDVPRASTVFTSRRLASLLPLKFAPEKKGFKIPPHPVINSAIISIALYENFTVLESIPDEPIRIHFRLLKSEGRSRPQCVFWHTEIDAWSPHGCYIVVENRTHVDCSCAHLSTFAILMDEGEESVFNVNPLKTICIVLLSITIAILTGCAGVFSCLSEVRSAQAHLHNALSICLIFLHVIFLLGIDKTENEYSCMIVSIGLHYFYLAVFTWVALETFHLYRRLAQPHFQIAQRADRQAVQFYYGLGFGVPAIIVATSVGLQPAGYGNARFCWLDSSDPLVGAMIVPICLTFIATCGGLIMSLREYLTVKRVDIIKEEVRRDIRLLSFLAPVLLFAWASSLSAVNMNSSVLYIITCILHLSVALFILVAHVLRSAEVKRAWQLERTKKERQEQLKNATMVTGNRSMVHTHKYLNNTGTTSSDTSKPPSDRFDRHDERMFQVKHQSTKVKSSDSMSESDGYSDSDGELLRRKAKKANKKLKKQKLPQEADTISEGGTRRTRIIWHDQADGTLASTARSTLKSTTEIVVPDLIPKMEKETLPEMDSSSALRRQKSILKNTPSSSQGTTTS